MAPDFSCKDCKDRTLGCHSHCEKYLEEKEKLNKKKEWEKNNKGVIITQGSFMGNGIPSKCRKKRKR